jgi:hypothetical protein
MNSAVESVSPPDHLSLHHIGLVLTSIQESTNSFAQALGATWDGNFVSDPLQKIKVTFLQKRPNHRPVD